MNKEEALKAVNEAPDRADIVVAIFPETKCERCRKPKQVLYSEYNKEEKKYWEICGDCIMNMKAKEVAIRKEKRQCSSRKKSQKKSESASEKREELLRIAVSV